MNKIFKNEQMYERANTRMAAAASRLASTDFPENFVLQLYCECANKVCLERASISYDDYKSVKAEDLAFVVIPEHYLPEFERVVSKKDTYWVVVKRPEKLNKPFEI